MYYKFERGEADIQNTQKIILQSLENGLTMMRNFSDQGSSVYSKAEKMTALTKVLSERLEEWKDKFKDTGSTIWLQSVINII